MGSAKALGPCAITLLSWQANGLEVFFVVGDLVFRIRRCYVAIGWLMALIAVAGFWPSYFGPLFAGTSEHAPVIHLHAVVYAGWLVLFITQASLVSNNRAVLHRRLGKGGAVYGVLMIMVGLLVTFSRFATRIEAGRLEEAQRALLYPLTDMLIFPVFFGAAIAYRKKPEIHKRLMVVASTYLLVAAALRLPFLGSPRSQVLFLAIWLSPIFLGMIYDFISRRMVHPVYVIGVAVLAISGFRDPLRSTEVWLEFTSGLARLIT